MSRRPEDVRALFESAVDIESAAAREAYLRRRCAGDAELRRQVESLLAAHDQAGDFLARPAAGATGSLAPDSGSPAAGGPESGAASGNRRKRPSTEPEPAGVATGDGHPAVAAPPAQTTPGLVVAGRYTLVKKLGEGGMGAVWQARQTEPVKRYVAVKLIKSGMDSRSVLARFEAERQALALMDHPNIAKVLDGGLHEHRPYFVMELVKGVPITEFCDARKLTPQERLELFIPVCQAIQHAHQKGIIHRDIKPPNVLIALYDERPVPKVIDFGVAKATGGTLTEHTIDTAFGGVVGTPQYMSPEQATFNNLDIDTRSDIYALGVLLYELLTGSPPFAPKESEKKGLLEMLRVVREEEPPRPSERLSTAEALATLSANRSTEPKKLTGLLRNELDWVVMKALEKDRTRRYETANGLAADVLRYLGGEPVQAHPPSTVYRLKKFVRRHRGQVMAASLVLFALLAGFVGTTIGLIQAERSAAAERAAKHEAEGQKQKADEEKAIALAVKDFLQHKLLDHADVTAQANALLKAGLAAQAKTDPTIRELLDRAAEELAEARIEANFPKQPLLQADILQTLGLAYRGVGEAHKAVGFLERSLALWKATLGPEHPGTLTCINNLAYAYQDAGKLDLALPLFEQTLKLRQAKLGPDHPDTLTSMNNLARGYYAAGKLDLALPLFKETLKLRQAKLGPDHPDTLATMGNLANAYFAVGKRDLALPLSEETLTLSKAKLGPDHPFTLITMNNLAALYHNAGKRNLTLPLFEQTLKLNRAKLGSDHPLTLHSMNNLAAEYQDARKLDLALPLYEETLKLQKAKLGPDHPLTLQTMSNLAGAYGSAKKLDLALRLSEETLKLCKVKLGDDHPLTLHTMSNLAGAYTVAKKLDLALSLYEETLKLQKAKLGDDHPDTLQCMMHFANAYEAAGKYNQALLLLQERLKLQKAKLGPDHLDTLLAMHTLAGAYRTAGRLDQSLALYEETLELQKAKLGPDHPDTLVTMYNFANASELAGKRDQALLLLKERLKLQKAKLGPDHPETLQSLDYLASAYHVTGKLDLATELLSEFRQVFPKDSPQLADRLAQVSLDVLQQKQWAEAEPLLRECLAIRQKSERDAWTTFHTQSLLGAALLGQKKYADAEPPLFQGYEGMKQREKTIPPLAKIRLTEALDRLVQLYEALEKKDEAAKWRKEWDALKTLAILEQARGHAERREWQQAAQAYAAIIDDGAPRTEGVHVQAGFQPGANVLEAIRQRVGELQVSGGAGLLHVVAAD